MEGECCYLSIIRSQFGTIRGERTEIARRTFKFEQRHFYREPETPKAQLDSELSNRRDKELR